MSDAIESRVERKALNEKSQNDQNSQENQRHIGVAERTGIADRTVIIVTCIGIGVALFLGAGPYTALSIIIGLALILTLHASDSREDWSWYQTASFAVAWAIASVLVVGVFLINPFIKPSDDQTPGIVTFVYALVVSLIAFIWRGRTVQLHYSLPRSFDWLFGRKAGSAKADTQSSASAKEEQASKAGPPQEQKKS